MAFQLGSQQPTTPRAFFLRTPPLARLSLAPSATFMHSEHRQAGSRTQTSCGWGTFSCEAGSIVAPCQVIIVTKALLQPFHCTHSQPFPRPPPPYPWAVFLSHRHTELQQLSGDIRSELEEPELSGSSPLGLAGHCLYGSDSPLPPFLPSSPPPPPLLPFLPAAPFPQQPASAHFLPLASPQKEDLFSKGSLSLTAALCYGCVCSGKKDDLIEQEVEKSTEKTNKTSMNSLQMV